MVAAQAYQVINERAIADRALSDKVYIIAAGNRLGIDQAYVQDMPLPLRDRFAEVEIYHDAQSWTNWAIGNVNPHLIAFVQWKESYLYKIQKKSSDKSSTPRGITRASNLIADRPVTDNKVHQLVSISCGEDFATEFQAYTKHFATLNWENIFKNPKIVKEFEVDKLFAVMGGLSEKYGKEKDQKSFDRTIKVIMQMKADFAISSLRMVKDLDFKAFKSLIKKCPDCQSLATEYGKYVM